MIRGLAELEVVVELSLAKIGWRGIPPTGENSKPDYRPTDQGEAVRCAARVTRVSAHMGFTDACLPKATALYHILRRRRIACEFLVGVRTRAGVVESHAWIQQGETILLGNLPDRDTYHTLRSAS